MPSTRPKRNPGMRKVVPGAATRELHEQTMSAPAPSAAPAASGGGGYGVQVSSQRSDAEAQAAFRLDEGPGFWLVTAGSLALAGLAVAHCAAARA